MTEPAPLPARVCPADGGVNHDGSARHCQYPAADSVVLVAGPTCCTWCACWRQECAGREVEALRILRMDDRETRRATLDRHEARFGRLSRDRLAAVILARWERNRAAAAASAE